MTDQMEKLKLPQLSAASLPRCEARRIQLAETSMKMVEEWSMEWAC